MRKGKSVEIQRLTALCDVCLEQLDVFRGAFSAVQDLNLVQEREIARLKDTLAQFEEMERELRAERDSLAAQLRG